eukprot:3359727-Pleurochrysis_carterae.AAC.9
MRGGGLSRTALAVRDCVDSIECDLADDATARRPRSGNLEDVDSRVDPSYSPDDADERLRRALYYKYGQVAALDGGSNDLQWDTT